MHGEGGGTYKGNITAQSKGKNQRISGTGNSSIIVDKNINHVESMLMAVKEVFHFAMN